MTEPAKELRLRDVVSTRFWLNYIISLLATCWIPLRVVTVSINGEVQSQKSIPLYKTYLDLMTGFRPGLLYTIGIHLGLCFLICYWVWYLVLRTSRSSDAESN